MQADVFALYTEMKIHNLTHGELVTSYRIVDKPLLPRLSQYVTTPDGIKFFRAGDRWVPYTLMGEEQAESAGLTLADEEHDKGLAFLNQLWRLTPYNPLLDPKYVAFPDLDEDDYE